jgi:hypothetical protein
VEYRVLRTAATTITHVFYAPGTETLTDPTGTPTYVVTDAAGATVTSGNGTVVGGGTGEVTVALAGQANLDLLTVAITATVAGASLTEYDTVEVVGGFFFGLAEGRASDEQLGDTERYPTWLLERARAATEYECEQICDRAFVQRYAYVTLDGTGTSQLILDGPGEDRSFRDFVSLRSLSMSTEVDGTFTAFTAGELADVAVAQDGTMRRASGDAFTAGWSNVRAGYVYGSSRGLPVDLKLATLTRFRTWCNVFRSGVPDRTTSFSTADGSTFRFAPEAAYRTGIPSVDAAYTRYSFRDRSGPAGAGGGPMPAGRTFTYNPQPYSLFHRK